MDNIRSNPLVSVIITSYNREAMIGKAIESALVQDYSNLEIIVSDNRSTDNSDEVIRGYCNDPRVRYSRNETNLGMLGNFRYASEHLAKGTIVTYISSDDYLVNDHFISEAVAVLTEHKEVVAYTGLSINHYLNTGVEANNSAYEYKRSSGLFNKPIDGKTMFRTFQKVHIINFGGTVFYREDLLTLGIFRENNTIFFDLQATLLLSLKGAFYLSDKPTYVQTFHDSNASQSVTSAAQARQNLSFTEVPYRAAKENNFLPPAELDAWMMNITRPYILMPMISLYKTDRQGYKLFSDYALKTHPAIYKNIVSDLKWKLFTLMYSNKLLAGIFEKIKPSKYA